MLRQVAYPPHFSKELKAMVGGFLMVNPSDRFSSNHHNGMQEIKALPYFKGLNWDGTAAAAITLGPFRHPFGYFDILLAISAACLRSAPSSALCHPHTRVPGDARLTPCPS